MTNPVRTDGLHRCSRCGIARARTEFRTRARVPSGLAYNCKHCQNQLTRIHRRKLVQRDEIILPKSQRCGRCRVVKRASYFFKIRGTKSGLSNACKTCEQRRNRESSARHSPEYKQKVNQSGRDARLKDKRRFKGYDLKKMYGVNIEQYEVMVERQKGLCAICGFPPPPGGKSLGIDHCHTTGVIRGLLCTRCNLGVGYFDDDPTKLDKAAKYMRASTQSAKVKV